MEPGVDLYFEVQIRRTRTGDLGKLAIRPPRTIGSVMGPPRVIQADSRYRVSSVHFGPTGAINGERPRYWKLVLASLNESPWVCRTLPNFHGMNVGRERLESWIPKLTHRDFVWNRCVVVVPRPEGLPSYRPFNLCGQPVSIVACINIRGN